MKTITCPSCRQRIGVEDVIPEHNWPKATPLFRDVRCESSGVPWDHGPADPRHPVQVGGQGCVCEIDASGHPATLKVTVSPDCPHHGDLAGQPVGIDYDHDGERVTRIHLIPGQGQR